MSNNSQASGHHTHCPRCGLALQVTSQGTGPIINYDFASWDRTCKSRALGGPSMCLAQACQPAGAPIDRDAQYRYDRPVDPRR